VTAPRVSVVVVTWRTAGEALAALRSLRAAEPELDLELIVVDNGSSADRLRELGQVDGLRLLVNRRNVGFARACNRGAAHATGEFVLFLNPDVTARPGALTRLLGEARRHPEAMIVGPQLIGPDGAPRHAARTFYTWPIVVARRTPLARVMARSRVVQRHLLLDRPADRAIDVDWLVGACLLMRRSDHAALGGFDPRFFLYFEDVDLCLRAWRAGRTVRRCGGAVFEHVHARASAGWPSRAAGHHLCSAWRFRRKWGGWPQRLELARSPALVFVNEGEGPLGERARRVAGALGGAVLAKDVLPGGRIGRTAAAAWQVLSARARLVWVLDVGVAGVVVAIAARLARARVILDTGDPYQVLMARTDEMGAGRLHLAGIVERLALGLCDAVVARGRGHVAALSEQGYDDVRWLPDGVDTVAYEAAVAADWRVGRGWDSSLVVGSVGSLLVDRRYQLTQGWELIEALRYAPKVHAAIVGDGPGLELLRRRARALDVAERVAFLGRCPADELPALVKSFDMCLVTQTDDEVGRSRTSGKLPLFLAAGRFVLASDVGEATRILPESMRLPFHGEFDPSYPARLGRRLVEIDGDRRQLAAGAELVDVARELFDYGKLEDDVRRVGREVMS